MLVLKTVTVFVAEDSEECMEAKKPPDSSETNCNSTYWSPRFIACFIPYKSNCSVKTISPLLFIKNVSKNVLSYFLTICC